MGGDPGGEGAERGGELCRGFWSLPGGSRTPAAGMGSFVQRDY